MTKSDLDEKQLNYKYLDWIYDIVCNDSYSKKNTYHMLFEYLYNREFYAIIPMDENRAEDGVNLRYRFGSDLGYAHPMITAYLDNRPCSVLEMMIALAVRCEDNIMVDPDIGDRAGQWFWEMIVNLGLGHMNDENFDRNYTEEVVDRFLERKYKKNGEGGLFKVKHPVSDMRHVEIWYQMCWHLDEVIRDH